MAFDEPGLLAALRAGDEDAFHTLVSRHYQAMIRVASQYVPSRAVAEEVVQETWLAVLEGLNRFEARSSLKTWMFRILVNRARTRGVREHRSTPVSSLVGDEGGEPAMDAERFFATGHRWAGHWAAAPEPWSDLPGDQVVNNETQSVVMETIRTMPPNQRTVITLRDVEQWTSEEVREAMGVSEVNQRVLLHRARARVRNALERHLSEAAVL